MYSAHGSGQSTAPALVTLVLLLGAILLGGAVAVRGNATAAAGALTEDGAHVVEFGDAMALDALAGAFTLVLAVGQEGRAP